MRAQHPKPQPGLFDRISRPLTRANATPASRIAAERSEPTAAEVMRMALAEFVPAGAQWNADEVAARIGVHWIRVRPRISQLTTCGLLKLVLSDPTDPTSPPVQRDSANKNPADVHEITPAGLLSYHSPAPLPTPPRPSRAGNNAA